MPLRELRRASASSAASRLPSASVNGDRSLYDESGVLNAAACERCQLIEVARNRIPFPLRTIRQGARGQREAGELLAQSIVHFLAYAALLAGDGLDQCAAECPSFRDIEREYQLGALAAEVDGASPDLDLEQPAVARQMLHLEWLGRAVLAHRRERMLPAGAERLRSSKESPRGSNRTGAPPPR